MVYGRFVFCTAIKVDYILFFSTKKAFLIRLFKNGG